MFSIGGAIILFSGRSANHATLYRASVYVRIYTTKAASRITPNRASVSLSLDDAFCYDEWEA